MVKDGTKCSDLPPIEPGQAAGDCFCRSGVITTDRGDLQGRSAPALPTFIGRGSGKLQHEARLFIRKTIIWDKVKGLNFLFYKVEVKCLVEIVQNHRNVTDDTQFQLWKGSCPFLTCVILQAKQRKGRWLWWGERRCYLKRTFMEEGKQNLWWLFHFLFCQSKRW